MDLIELIASTLGLSVVAGMRLYATFLPLGLAIWFGLLHLSAGMDPLRALAHPAMPLAASIAYLAEFLDGQDPVSG
jgi:Domain of unknown function (DUF4126)